MTEQQAREQRKAGARVGARQGEKTLGGMQTTSILLPSDLRDELDVAAKDMGTSMGLLIRFAAGYVVRRMAKEPDFARQVRMTCGDLDAQIEELLGDADASEQG